MEGSDLPDKEFKLIVKDIRSGEQCMNKLRISIKWQNISKQITEFKNTITELKNAIAD